MITKVPAFGFETQYAYPVKLYNKKVDKVIKTQVPDDVKNNAAKLAATKEDYIKRVRYSNNSAKIMGYIPLISFIKGIQHISVALKNRKCYSINFIIRGVFEILQLGILLLIPDLIITCIRNHQAKGNPFKDKKVRLHVKIPIPKKTVGIAV